MNKVKLLLSVGCLLALNALAQQDSSALTRGPVQENTPQAVPEKIYRLRPAADIPIVAIGGGWSGYAFTKIYSKKASTKEEILSLNKADLPAIDRWAAGKSDPAAAKTSDLFFYGSIPVPFFLMLDKKIRHDGWKVAYLYLESMAITGMLYTGSVYFVDRYRPETYNTSLPVEKRMGGNYKDAFFAGHPALVSTSLFFTAKVYSDYHPGTGLAYGLYGLAIAGTGTTIYLRHIAGKHFPTDLIVGTTIGTACGILVPHFHKLKNRNPNLGMLPYYDGTTRGVIMTYTFR